MPEFDLPDAARLMNGQEWVNPGKAFTVTCDWGDCDADTFAIVLSDDGWLSMCRMHTAVEVASVLEPESEGKK